MAPSLVPLCAALLLLHLRLSLCYTGVRFVDDAETFFISSGIASTFYDRDYPPDMFTFHNTSITAPYYMYIGGVFTSLAQEDITNVRTIPFASAALLFAPFWANIDTRLSGVIAVTVLRETASTRNVTDFVREALNRFGEAPDYYPMGGAIFTWYNVSTAASTGLSGSGTNDLGGSVPSGGNTFQVFFPYDPANPSTYIFALYPEGGIQWTLDGFSPNTHAQVGFNVGDGSGFTLPHSGTSNLVKLTTESNFDDPGKWAFRVSGLQVEEPPKPRSTGCSLLYPNYLVEINKFRTTHTYRTVSSTSASACILLCNKDKRKCQGFVFYKKKCHMKRKFGGNSVRTVGSMVVVKCFKG